MQINRKTLPLMSRLVCFLLSFFSAVSYGEAYAAVTSFQEFQLGVINNSTHALTFQKVISVMSVCDTLENKKTIHPGDGLVLTESMVSGESYMNCLYTFTTENGQPIMLQIMNPTYRYFRKATYQFYDDRLRPLSTLSTPESSPALPQNLMHKSAVLTLNYF